MENTHNFLLPRTNLVGVGSLKDLPNELLDYKMSKVLIVTDKNMNTLGYVNFIEKILKSLFISYEIFDEVLHPNPTVAFVEEGLKYVEKGINILKRDFSLIISIGGGTNHDTAKGISIVASNGGAISDYEGYSKILKPTIPQIAINTTAGSGSEVSSTAIITDHSRKTKMAITSSKMIPMISVNDPLFMPTMPKEVTASSGIDVISHSIEAFSAIEASPITDSLALRALNTTVRYLTRAYENGNDMEAREKMMFAGLMAGMAFNNAGLGYVHSIAHQLGGFYEENAHGCYNAVILPYVLDFNAVSIPDERIIKIAEAMELKVSNKVEAVDKIIEKFKSLCSDIGLPGGLGKMGVDEDDIAQMSENALKDICSLTNPRQGTVEEIMALFKAAM